MNTLLISGAGKVFYNSRGTTITNTYYPFRYRLPRLELLVIFLRNLYISNKYEISNLNSGLSRRLFHLFDIVIIVRNSLEYNLSLLYFGFYNELIVN